MDEESSLLSHSSTATDGSEASNLASPRRFSRYVFAASLLLVMFMNYLCIFLPSPFYPQIAAQRKGSKADTEVGVMVGSIQLSAGLVSLFVGGYVKTLGVRFLVTSGAFVVGACTVIFSFLGFVKAWEPFIGLSIAIRFVMGFGQAAYDTTSMALLLSMFPSRTATTWSFVELTVALGYISGAPFGGFLNEIEGFYFPFVISGSILLVFTPLLVYLMSDSQLLSENMYTEDEGEVTSWKLLKMPPIVLVCANLSSCFISMQLFETSMAVFLDKEFGWSSSYIGLVFLVSGAVYFVMTIFTGPLVDATNPRVLMIIGLLMEGCAMMAVGPSFVFSFLSPKPWCVYLSMVLFGLGMPLITISAGPDMIRTATLRGYEKNMSLNGAVSGLVLAATFLSGTVGAPIAGGLTAAFDFRHSSSYFAFFNFLLVIISIVATASEAFMSRRIMHN